jgi:ParB family transcriptional regulator, chromosome partitioning protein
MVAHSKGLGRGLQSLLNAQPTVSASRGGGTLPISLMQASAFQPRRAIHQQPLEELAASIKTSGVIEPIVVRALPAGTVGVARYEIVAGERRWRAAQLAGLSDIPVIVRQLSDKEAVAIALIENIQREDLTAAEEARSLKRLIGEFSLTHQEVADAIGRSRAAVTNLIRLLDLPESVLKLIDSKRISMGHARALLGLDDEAAQERLAHVISDRELSVRDTEKLVQHAARSDRETAAAPQLAVVTQVLRTRSVRVQLHERANGPARIVVDVTDAKLKTTILEAIEAALPK